MSIKQTAFLYNSTRKIALAKEGKVLRGLAMGFGAMFFGLKGRALLFVWWRPSIIVITNVFVPEDIDIAWLDESMRIVDTHKSFRKGTFRTANKTPAKYVIELPSGTLESTRTRVGDYVHCRVLKTL